MNKKILFGLMAVSILTAGLLIWSCGDDGEPTPPPQLKIVLAASLTEVSICPESAGPVTLTATVTKGGALEGKEVSFEITSKPTDSEATLSAPSGTTDAEGIATVTLNAGTMIGDIVVEATVEDESAEVTIAVGGVHVEALYDEPTFRVDELAIDTDLTDNQLGPLAVVINPEFKKAVDAGDINIINVLIDLETIVGTNEVTGALIMGLCEPPNGPTTCPGGPSTTFYVDPASHDENGCIEYYSAMTIADGAFTGLLPELTISVEALALYTINVVLKGQVNGPMTEISDGSISCVLPENVLVSAVNAAMSAESKTPLADCVGIRNILGFGPAVDLGTVGITACTQTPTFTWCYCEDIDGRCAGVSPLSAECEARCEGADPTCAVGPYYSGSEDGYAVRMLFHASKATLLRKP